MKIVFTGGGSGGHFYPIIAVAEALRRIAEKEHLLKPKFYFVAPDPYDKELLFEYDIEFLRTPAGKMRRYFSLLNVVDAIKTLIGLAKALFQLYSIFPDVIFSKGGYASFPTLFAARILGIPVVIHESDSIPGKTNLWAGKFAKRIALSYSVAGKFFPEDRIAVTGNPVREELRLPQKTGAYEFLKLEQNIPTILILGGSLGAERINDAVIAMLPKLVERFQVIHQTGEKNFTLVSNTAGVVLEGSTHGSRYHPFPYMNTLGLKMAAGVTDLVISRAGSTIFEIALWGIPSIIVPLADSASDHQRNNAFTYAKAGACIVVEEKNLSEHVMFSEIVRLMDRGGEREEMKRAAREFARPEAAEKIAKEMIQIALSHEKL